MSQYSNDVSQKEFFRESRQDTQLKELRANEESSYQFTYNMR